ncbi:PhzF family phenazine biosynthesis protein [Siphonobacter sp. SORGH_AS_0500]|uniref:PhzF family phenazine biosynthesis protein n=1 Tax=Siphonobacter sp. SORGH_AS_0500 TaxID=1864824 RepID=UPI00285FD38B|nr:PhzF family phenazine biosynthesis protein [Siphonobacter sp. SORGH_AS_0500]MDR6196829.1 PhzF family phenazine biosynthesis protein [Siphonobacter sp. SORGH_AS_0500]
MTLPIYQVDAFTAQLFKGNPAAVVPLESWLSKEEMLHIAAENNLAETAFFVKSGVDYELKWFTPLVEIDLCGHATVATAKVLYDHLGYSESEIRFQTNSGLLTVRKDGKKYTLNFPANVPYAESTPEGLLEYLGVGKALEVLKGRTNDYLVVLESEAEVAALTPDFRALKSVNARGIIVTAKGDEADFVSRFFGPAVGVDEDPVTGSAHTVLVPYWAEKLGKSELFARQISKRGGELWVKLLGNRVEMSGEAVMYLKGEIFLP